MNRPLILVPVIIALVLTEGCFSISNGQLILPAQTNQSVQDIEDRIITDVAALPDLNVSTVDTFEGFVHFCDTTNALVNVLNKQTDLFHIPSLQATQENWDKASKLIAEYTPLINNYNEVISSARACVTTPRQDSRSLFYKASGKFAFEAGVIYWAVFYGAAFKTVGIVYKSVGLNTLAFKCGPCVTFILSNAHWTIRAALVEASSTGANALVDLIETLYANQTLASFVQNGTAMVNYTESYLRAIVIGQT